MPSLGSQDCIEDAVDSLQLGTFPYLLITGTHTDQTRLDSSLDAESRATLLEFVRNGELERLLLEHFRRNPIDDDPA